MYTIKNGNNILHDPRLDELSLLDPKLNLELNKVGELTFGILPVHPYFETLQKMKSIITVYDDNVMIFRGRILNDESGFYNEKTIVCEGELGFLNDTIQRPYEFTGTPAELFTNFITEHNSQSTPDHQFKIGNITVTDPNNYIARSDSGYTNTWKSINDKLIGILGGYLWIRHESDGNYIDYLEDFSVLNPQIIEFGVNLMDFKKMMKGEDIATAIIPLGAEDEATGERITIKSVNNNVDYVYSQEAVNEYGWIFKVVEWDDVTVPSNLLTKANAYVATSINLQGSIELDALDLPDQNSFRLGRYVKVKSDQHGIDDENFLINKLDLDLSNPMNNKLTLGEVFSTFADESLNMNKKQGDIVEVIHNVTTNIKGYVVEKANDAEANAKAYADIKKTEAETASKAYSDAQIALEKTRADAYADGVLTDAEAYALAQAEAKRDEAKTYAEQKATQAETASKSYTDGQLNNFATAIDTDITNLQNQIDGSITTWFYGVAPTTSNAPANTWTTTDDKNKHLGDLYYNTVTGYAYRWQVVNNVYSWTRITDSDVTKALSDASKAQDTADSKRRVFSSQPVPPYDLNDLWVQGTSGDIMRCTTARTTGVYVAGDWVKASKYTDDTTANANLQTAKTYAETKAQEARTASEAYALAQANLAQTNAEAYADGVVTAEEQARIDADTAKLAEAKTYAETKATQAETASKAYADTVQTNAQSYALGLANSLQTQVDGKIETFAQTADPSTAWTTTALKNAHVGDLWYHTTSKITKIWTGTAWVTMEDSVANNAQALAQTKNKIFSSQPTTPYIIGDLWVQGTSGEIMRCSTARATGSYTASDWVKASKYTDDTRAVQAETNAKAYADGLKTAIDADIDAVETSVTNLNTTITTTFKDGVIQEAEAKAIEKYLNTINAEKSDLDARYTKIYAEADLTGTPKSDLNSKKTAYNTAHTNLISSINTAISDGKTTPTEKTDVDNKFTAYRTALSNLATSFETAIRAIETTKIANIQIGGRNLLLKSDIPVTNSSYPIQSYNMTEKMSASKTYTIRLWGTLGAGKTSFTPYLNGGSVSLGAMTNNGDGTFSLTFVGKDSGVTTGDFINIYPMPSGTVVNSTIEKIKLEVGNKATDYTKAPEDDQQYVNDVVSQMAQELNSTVEQTSTSLRTEISEQYYTKGTTDQLVSAVGTELEQTKTAFNFQFAEITKNINDVQAGNDAEFSEIKKYIRFENGDIILGESTNNVTVRLENNQLAFYVGGVKVSYWLVDETGANPPKFYVTDGEFLNSLRLGKFAWTPRSNGNLSFGKVI